MRFSTIFTVLATGAMALAAAVPEIVEKRSVADIQNAFNTLSGAADTIIPKFDDCMDDTCSKEIVTELVGAIDTCTSTISGLTGGPATSDLGSLVANVVNKISVALEEHKTKCGTKCPTLIDIYAPINTSLPSCLQKAVSFVTDLLPLVTPQLPTLANTLQGLGLNSIVQAVGLA